MRIQVLFILQLLLLILAIVYKSSKPPKHNKPVKNHDMVSYSRDVVPALDRYCYSCHTSANAAASLDLSNYDHVYITVLSHTLINTEGVFPVCAAFYNSDSIRQDSIALLKIQHWIKQGALYN